MVWNGGLRYLSLFGVALARRGVFAEFTGIFKMTYSTADPVSDMQFVVKFFDAEVLTCEATTTTRLRNQSVTNCFGSHYISSSELVHTMLITARVVWVSSTCARRALRNLHVFEH